ncbi:MAG: transposase [Algibacter sp.]
MSVKPGKARKLNYMSQLSVDTGHHVITDIKAYHADVKDSQYLPDICNRLEKRLQKEGLLWHNCIAGTGYSSGENYAFLEEKGLRSYIPPHETYKGGPDGFKYHKADDYYTCPQGKVIPFKKVFFEKKNNTKKKGYRALKHVCVDCPIRSQCLGKSAQEKKFTVTFYREEYERNNARVNSPRGRYMKGKRQSSVEPVFGTLTQFLGLRKINTLGLKQANKVMHLSAMAYNLKKYLKFTAKTVKSDTKVVCLVVLNIKALIRLQIRLLTRSYI